MLFPGPPRRGSRQGKQVTITGGNDQGTLWILDADKRPRSITVKTGLTDGINTQILDGDIIKGTQVIVSANAQGK